MKLYMMHVDGELKYLLDVVDKVFVGHNVVIRTPAD